MSDLATIAVVYATKGRSDSVGRAIAALARQTLAPSAVIVSATSTADLPEPMPRLPGLSVVLGPSGLPAQRNRGLDLVREHDVVVFFDDDFLPCRTWLETARAIFAAHPRLGAVTGAVLMDGIIGPGLTWGEAERCVEAHECASVTGTAVRSPYSPYGCNMAFRTASLQGLRFDERLVLYGWQEDRDMGGQVERAGWSTGYAEALAGVHLGVKSARSPGKRLGYSQIVNVAYLMRKGTMPYGAGAAQMSRNILANMRGWLMSDRDIDRAGRLRGNLLGLKDVAVGKLRPERAAEFE